MGKTNFFIDRQLEDIEIYSYFADYIIISDVRFPKEIDIVKEKFYNVISIGVKRYNYDTDLSIDQQNDVTEISLDDYDKFDYVVDNYDDTNLYDKAIEIIKDFERVN